MTSFLTVHTFLFFLLLTCSFLEVYGRGGRGSSGGSRGGGGYSSRGSSSSRSSSRSRSSGGYKSGSSNISGSSSRSSSGSSSSGGSVSSSKSNYRSISSGKDGSSNSGNYGSLNHNNYGSISSGKYGSRRGGYGTYVFPSHHNRMYGGGSGLRRNDKDDNSKIQESHANKVGDTEKSTTETWRHDNFRSKTTPYSPPLYWNIATVKPTTENWYNWLQDKRRRMDEPSIPFQSELDKIAEMHKKIAEVQDMDLMELASGNRRRYRFQKRHACEGSCEESRQMENDASTINISPPLDALSPQEIKDETPMHLVKDSEAIIKGI